MFTARAVYLSDAIQRMAVDWEARSKLMSPEERAELEREVLGQDPRPIKVLVGFYTPEEEQNNLSESNSIWIPYLQNNDGTVTRAACTDMSEDNARLYMRFLRWDLSWSKLYLLCFQSTPDLQVSDDGWINMVISGPQGQGEIRLQVVPPDEEQ